MRSRGQLPPQSVAIPKRRPRISLLVVLWIVLALPGAYASGAESELVLEVSILRAKPGVVVISSEAHTRKRSLSLMARLMSSSVYHVISRACGVSCHRVTSCLAWPGPPHATPRKRSLRT